MTRPLKLTDTQNLPRALEGRSRNGRHLELSIRSLGLSPARVGTILGQSRKKSDSRKLVHFSVPLPTTENVPEALVAVLHTRDQ